MAGEEPLLDLVQIELLRASLESAELRELYAELRPSVCRVAAEIRAGIEMCDLDQVKRSAHTLKGVASSFGALRLSRYAESIQLHCVSIGEARGKMTLLADTIDQTVDMLTDIARGGRAVRERS